MRNCDFNIKFLVVRGIQVVYVSRVAEPGIVVDKISTLNDSLPLAYSDIAFQLRCSYILLERYHTVPSFKV
jgi:hypothetical protein